MKSSLFIVVGLLALHFLAFSFGYWYRGLIEVPHTTALVEAALTEHQAELLRNRLVIAELKIEARRQRELIEMWMEQGSCP